MKYSGEITESLQKARKFTLEGGEQILENRLDDAHSISPSPGATALATLALMVLGAEFAREHKSGLQWLAENRHREGWGKVPGGKPDPEINYLVQTVLIGSGGPLGKLFLLSRVQELSKMVLSLGRQVVHGLEGPEADEILLPGILEKRVLQKLPNYGRPVVVAASLLAAPDANQKSVKQAVEYLYQTQSANGSWSEDIVSTSMAIIALLKAQEESDRIRQAGKWLAGKQYQNGAWAAFDQLHTWAVSWMINIYKQFARKDGEEELLQRAAGWLQQAQNSDGSYGATPPFTHPDLDDTAVALTALQSFAGADTAATAVLLRRLQNRDGSWGTFPSFEKIPPHPDSAFPVYITSLDVTVHALDALSRRHGYETEVLRGIHWLLQQQLPDGEFPAVWFEGPVYGTAQTIDFLSRLKFGRRQRDLARQTSLAVKKGIDCLISLQNADGSWGSSVIETSMALSSLCRFPAQVAADRLEKGANKVLSRQLANGSFLPSYQGIYAKGWNYEEPITTTLTAVQALERYQAING